MGLFSFRKKDKKTAFPITGPDKTWVIENLTWLIQVYGPPHMEDQVVLFTKDFFPSSIKGEGDLVGNLISDLKSILGIESANVTYDLQVDIRDFKGLPYEIEGKPFQSGLVIAEKQYHIILANNLLKHEKTLLSSIIYEFMKIRLDMDKYEYDTGDDTDLFLYLAGVYWGFGPLLYQGLVDVGKGTTGDWETKWSFISDLPEEVMAYAIALELSLRPEADISWKADLSERLENLLNAAIEYQKKKPVHLIMKGEAEAENLYESGLALFERFDWDQAIEIFRKALFLETSNPLKADIYNSLGYCHMRLGDLEGSLTNFKIAIDLNGHSYAFANMAYVLVLLGRPDAAKGMIEILPEVYDLKGYAHRNIAMYHALEDNDALAEEHFQKALDTGEPVDLLEFHYSEYLLQKGREEEAMDYLRRAVEKGEPEAIAQYQMLGN